MKNTEPDKQQSDLPAKIPMPAQRALQGAGYTQLEQLSGVTEADLAKLHGAGPKAIRMLREALKTRGLAFAGTRQDKSQD